MKKYKYTFDDPDIKSYETGLKKAYNAMGYDSGFGSDNTYMYVLLPYDENGDWTEDKISFGSKKEALTFCKRNGILFLEDN